MVITLNEDVDEAIKRHTFVRQEFPTLEVKSVGFLSKGERFGLIRRGGEVAEGATAMTLVAGEPDVLAIEEDVGGEADRFLAHPFHSLERLEGERAAVDDDVGVDHVCIGYSSNVDYLLHSFKVYFLHSLRG